MMFELVVQARFAAAHFLRNYEGPCARLHGHTWLVEAVFRGQQLDDKGMLIDFKILKNVVREVIDHLDHQNLNELPQFRAGSAGNPTAENLAMFIYHSLQERLTEPAKGVRVAKVRVYESPEAGAAYWEEE